MPDADPDLMTLFADALERTDPAARASYLDDACGGDAALRRRVEALLAAHEGAGRFLDPEATGEADRTGSALTLAWTSPPERPLGFVPRQVIAGRYTLVEILGEGGMGTVYRADQTSMCSPPTRKSRLRAWRRRPGLNPIRSAIAWPGLLFESPGGRTPIDGRGPRLAMAACRLRPDDGAYFNTLGVAQYRSGSVDEALATLMRSNQSNNGSEPARLAFLALAQNRLGPSEKAPSTLARLRERMKHLERVEDQDSRALLRQSEVIELDDVSPPDPFAR